MLFQPVTTREFGAVVKRDRAAAILVQFFEPLLEFLMHMVGVLGSDLHDDRVSRLAVHQRGQAARAWRTEHGVAFEVAQSQSPLDDFRTLGDASALARKRVFSAVGSFAAPPQERFPVLAVPIPFDPSIDRWGGNAALGRLGVLLLQPTGDLLGRPSLDQGGTHGLIQLRIIQLTREGTFPPSPLALLLGLAGVVFITPAVTPQFAADRRGGTP